MIRLALLALAIVPFAIGCSSGDAASTDSGTTGSTSTNSTAPGNTQTAAMGKCEQCSKEVAVTALHDHGGKKLCADCDGH